MPTEQQCSECGAVLPEDAPKGLCPVCLMGAGLEPPAADAVGGTICIEGEGSPSPPKPAIAGDSATEKGANERIGRYKLLQKLGEGGCGIVYMAEQTEPVRRKVALKVIKLGMDTKQVIARFEAERQALTLMDHPNIAKVLDAGATGTGRPYFVMELVKGIRITDYCDQNHLSTAERLGLFTQVCQAIQHAHQKGIIHRDVKPSNILVTLHDGVPVPKVIDFGIAKATEQPLTDKTVFTAFGQFMGTPAYMSPEQAELSGLDIDTRSDIYSLGVLLYELLTGRTPFDAKDLLQAGLDEMRRKIREEEPVRPSTRLSTMVDVDLTEVAQQRQSEPGKLTRFIRGDLDWIVMKCLEKDRTRRYETANGLAMDLRRHLNNEPVVACPPSHLYRFQKAIQRNKLAFGAAVLVACSLVLGLSLSTWMYLREKQARQEAIARAQSERKAKEAETTSRKQAQAVSDYLIQAFRSPDPARDGRTVTIVEVLERDAHELQDKFVDDPLTKATLLLNIALAYVSLGLVERSLPLFEQGVELRSRLLGAEDTATLWAKQDLALHYWVCGRTKQALPLMEEVFRVRREKLGPDHSDTLSAQMAVANYRFSLGRTQEGLDLMEHGFKVLKGKLGADHIEIFWATTGMADMYRSLGRTREALALDEPLLKLRTAKMGLDHPDTLHSLRAVAQDYVELGRLDDAVALLRDTVKLSTAKLGSDHSQTLLAIRTLAGVLRSQGRLAEAQEILQGQASAGDQAKRESAATTGSSPQAGGQVGAPKNPSETAGEPEERVDAFVRNGRWQEAISELAKALELSPTNHALLRKRGEILGRIGHWKEAAASLSKSIEAEPTDSRPYLFLAPTMLLIDDVEGYRQVCRRAVTQFSGTRDLAPADTLAKVCALHPSSGVDLSVAAKAAETAVTLGKQTEYLPWFALCKGLTEYRQEHFTGAAEWAQRSLSAAGQIPERDAAAHLVLAMAQMRLHQTTASRDAFAKGVELVEQKLPKIDGGDLGWQWVDVIIANILLREAKALNHLSPEEQANTFARSGRWKEAAAETVRAIESEPTNHLLFHMLAPLLVATRDLTGYRQHCRKVPLRFGGTTDPDTADRMAKDALILPDSGVDIEAVRAWAATAVSGPPTPADAWHHSVRGLAEYRQGNFAQAAEWLGKVPIDGTEPERDAQVLLLQAMTQQHRTNTPAARAFLAKGAAIMNEKLPQMESGNVGDDWIDWIIAQALWREATALFVNTGTRKID